MGIFNKIRQWAKKGAFSVENKKTNTPLLSQTEYNAIKEGKLETLQKLVENNADILKAHTPVGTVLHLAAESNQLEIVKWLLENGMNIDEESPTYQDTAITLAALNGHYEMVNYLLQQGATVNFETPHADKDVLFAAIFSGNKEVVQLLIDHGVDTTIRYFERKDAEMMAKEQNQMEILKLIQEYNATLPANHIPRKISIHDNETSAHTAIRMAFEEVYGSVQAIHRERCPTAESIEVHIIYPSKAHPYYVLFTVGLSDKAFGHNSLYVENMMKVPEDWLDGDTEWANKEKIWPLHWAAELANVLHREKFQPERGAIVPNNGDLADSYEVETHFSCMLISTPTDSDIQHVHIEGKEIRIDELVPIHKAEVQYVETNGYAALQEKLTAAHVQEVIDFQRPAVVDMSLEHDQLAIVKRTSKRNITNAEKIRQCFETEYGPIALQFKGLTVESNTLLPIRGNIIYPTKKHPYYVIFTLGVSDNVSTEGVATYLTEAYEIMMKLPLNWVSDESEWMLPEKNWPLRLIAELGYHVRENSLEMDGNTTFPVAGEMAAILSEYTNMTHLLARVPVEDDVYGVVNERFLIATTQLIPIYESEMDYAEGIYGEDLIDYLEKQRADNVLVVNRPPSI